MDAWRERGSINGEKSNLNVIIYFFFNFTKLFFLICSITTFGISIIFNKTKKYLKKYTNCI